MRITVDASDTVTVRFPKNGQRTWLRVRLGPSAQHEVWIRAAAARQLYAALGTRLAELDADSAARDAASNK
jgi:hypothetical protein